jgi:hypothetical protein
MFEPGRKTTSAALRGFYNLTQVAQSWEERYGWTNHTQAEVEAIWDEVVAKIPAGATKILELGSGDGGLYRKIKAARPGVGYVGVDFIPENVRDAARSRGTITCASVAAADTVTVAGVTLTASGSQTDGGLDFDETAGDDVAVATSLVAAINAGANAVTGVHASNYNGASAVVTVWATTPGTAGDAITLASSSGTTLAVSGATLTEGLDPTLFQVGGVRETLMDPAADWDFVISVACVHTFTDDRGHRELFELIDAKAAKGYLIVADKGRVPNTWLSAWMTSALATSVNAVESYYDGTRAFMADALLKGLWPYYVHRDSTTAATPPDPPEYLLVFKNGRANKCFAKAQHADALYRKNLAAPTDFEGVVVDAEGRVTGMATQTVTTVFPNGLPGRDA